MKTLFFISLFVVFGLFQPRLAHADGEDESLREFESEVERVDMQDIAGQTEGAVDEAQHQEQLERQHKQDLIELRAKKASLSKKAKVQIADANYRRIKAEKAAALYDSEIRRLKKEVAGLEESISSAQARAEDAEDLTSEERDELNEYRQERRELLNRTHHSKQTPTASRKIKDEDLEAYHEATSPNDDF